MLENLRQEEMCRLTADTCPPVYRNQQQCRGSPFIRYPPEICSSPKLFAIFKASKLDPRRTGDFSTSGYPDGTTQLRRVNATATQEDPAIARQLRLWGRPTSARTLKVLWALAEIGLDFEFILASATMGASGHVSKGGEPYGVVETPDYRAMNPNGTVPTIDDDGFVLWESNSIVRYLAMQYAPDLLYGNDIRTFASASRWMDWENNELLHGQHILVMQLVRLPEDQRDPDVLEAARQELLKPFGILDDALSKMRYVAGDQFTMGDIPLGIRAHRWHLFDIERPAMPNLERWYADIRERPAFKEWIADPANHLSGCPPLSNAFNPSSANPASSALSRRSLRRPPVRVRLSF